MAYSKNAPAEHPSRTIVKMMQAGLANNVFPRVLLLCGKEDFLVDWSRSYLKEGLISPAAAVLDCAVFSEEAIEADDIIAACETPPLLSRRKLVIVDRSDIFTLTPKDLSSADVQKLADYIPSLPESTMLVFCCEKPNKTKAIYKAAAKCGIVYDFTPLDDATLGGWMAKRFIAAKKNSTKAELVNFARICGYGDAERNYTLYNLENDLKKIFALYDKEYISLEDMLAAAQGQAEVNAFQLLDSAFSGKKGRALEILHASIDAQSPSKEMGVVLSFLGLLISQLEIMLEGRERQADGMGYYDIVKDMKINEYRFKKAMEGCRSKTVPQLRSALDRAFQIEKDLKSGNMDGRTALELFIGTL